MLIFYYVKKDIITKDYLSMNEEIIKLGCNSIHEESGVRLSEIQKVTCSEKKILLNDKYKKTEEELLQHIDLYFWLSLIPFIITIILALREKYIVR